MKTSVWEFPTEHRDLQAIKQDSKLKYLRYVKDKYIFCWDNNIRVYQKKAKILDTSFIPLVVGAIILVIIKTF